MISDAKNKLDAELARLETLYYVSTILYGKEMQAKYKQGSAKQALPVVFKSSGWERQVAHNAGHFRVIVGKTLPQTLRETILVRMVSALEVFLTDMVRELYASRRDLLQRAGPIELPYSKLASVESMSEVITLLVNRDCRNLTGGGLVNFEKYFRQQFQIELKSLTGFAKLRELHDRRHLLVHRLGSVDEEYRHKYNVGKHRLSVDQEYLLTGIQTIRDFSSSLATKASPLALLNGPKAPKPKMLDLSLDLQLLSEEALPIVDPEFFFLYNERYFKLGDLIFERTPTSTGIVLRLRGPSGVIRAYKRKIKRFAEEHRLSINATKTRNLKVISADILDKVAAELPAQPWSTDTEKAVAKKLGWKIELVRECIRQLRIRNP